MQSKQYIEERLVKFLNLLLKKDLVKTINYGGSHYINESTVEQEVLIFFKDYESLKIFNEDRIHDVLEDFVLDIMQGTKISKHW